MKTRVTDYLLYRWRYLIGYTLLALLVVGVLALVALYIPGSLRAGEMRSSLASGALSMHSIDPATIADLPYHLLQRLSFLAFGVTTVSIKLPSILLAGLTAFGIFLLVRVWFRRNIAILATAIAVTSAPFLFLAQDGTPSIMFSFVAIWLLVACTYMTRARLFSTFWKVVVCVLTATAFYIPLGIYVVVALAIAASLHPHIRYTIRRIAKVRLAIAIVLGLVALVPLAQAIVINHTIALTLLGIPHTISWQDNVVTVGQDLFGFFLSSDGYLLRPLFSLGAIILMGVGVYKFLTVKYTARSYTVFLITLFLIPLIVINPTHITDIFPIAVLMIAMGITTLITNWYRLFPRNPYARITGLIPISVLIVGMMLTGVSRFTYSYTYNANVLGAYSNDLKLLDRTLATTQKGASIALVTTAKEADFYKLVAHYDSRFSVGSNDKADVTIVTHDRYKVSQPTKAISTIVTNRMANDSDRFYVYKLSAQ